MVTRGPTKSINRSSFQTTKGPDLELLGAKTLKITLSGCVHSYPSLDSKLCLTSGLRIILLNHADTRVNNISLSSSSTLVRREALRHLLTKRSESERHPTDQRTMLLSGARIRYVAQNTPIPVPCSPGGFLSIGNIRRHLHAL